MFVGLQAPTSSLFLLKAWALSDITTTSHDWNRKSTTKSLRMYHVGSCCKWTTLVVSLVCTPGQNFLSLSFQNHALGAMCLPIAGVIIWHQPKQGKLTKLTSNMCIKSNPHKNTVDTRNSANQLIYIYINTCINIVLYCIKNLANNWISQKTNWLATFRFFIHDSWPAKIQTSFHPSNWIEARITKHQWKPRLQSYESQRRSRKARPGAESTFSSPKGILRGSSRNRGENNPANSIRLLGGDSYDLGKIQHQK